MMKLYSAAASPFARKVRVCLLELGINDQVEFMDAASTPVAPNDMLIVQNPLGKIPCLISEDGAAIEAACARGRWAILGIQQPLIAAKRLMKPHGMVEACHLQFRVEYGAAMGK